jgi:hypothetical protein
MFQLKTSAPNWSGCVETKLCCADKDKAASAGFPRKQSHSDFSWLKKKDPLYFAENQPLFAK